MLQFITDYKSDVPVTEQVRKVLEGGCNWIQVSMPGASDAEVSGVINDIMPLCLEKQAFLLLTDRADLAKQLNVGGVVLSHNAEALPSQARVFLGAAAVIGTTALSIDDVVAVRSLDVDFISIPLPAKDVARIIKEMDERDILIPVVAGGNVRYDDLDALFDAKVNGVAVSEAIATAPDIAIETRRFMTRLAAYKQDEKAR